MIDQNLIYKKDQMQPNQQRLLLPQNNNRYQIQPSVFREDDDIHPRELSGDENDPQKLNVRSNYTQQQGQKGKANFTLIVATIIKSTIGTGIISLPYSVGQLGLVLGILIFLAAAALNLFGSRILLKAKNLSRHSNYNTIFYVIWENKMAKAIGSFVIFLYNIGLCIIMMIIFKQAVNKIFIKMSVKDQFYNNEYFIVAVMAVLEIPFTFVKKIEKLKIIAFFGAIGIFVFTLSFTIFFIVTYHQKHFSQTQDWAYFPQQFWGAVSAVPNVILAVGFQMNFFPIFKGMKKANDRNMQKAVIASNLFCTLVYLLVGILGYIYYRNSVDINFLLSLEYEESKKAYFLLVNCGFLFSVCCAFPIIFFGCRNNFIAIIDLIINRKKKSISSSGLQEGSILHIGSPPEGQKKRLELHFRLNTIAVYCIILGVAFPVEKSQHVFNIFGALSAFPIVILLPCLFYFKLVQMRNIRRSVKYHISRALFVTMIPVLILTMIAQYLK